MATIINADTSDGLKLTSDTSGEIKLQSAGADIATVNSSGITLATGKDLTLSSTALDASASGIYLGGTASANLLDDYEEGTWTPVLKAGATTLTVSEDGRYVKTGNMVCASVILNNIVTSGSGNLTCTLPFTSNTLAVGALLLSRFTNPSNATYAVAYLLIGNDYVTPHWVYNNNQNPTAIQVSHVGLSGASDMYFSIVYRTA
jgi:hypothetical protein